MIQKKIPKYKLLLLAIFLYLLFGGGVVFLQFRWITEFQYISMGQSAMRLAEIAANTLQISPTEVVELEAMQFEEILSHPCNEQLAQMFALSSGDDSIKYVYVIRALSPEKIKYRIDEQNAAFFEESRGTELDYIWLLDVIVNKNEQVVVNETNGYYDDLHRYTHAEDYIRDANAARQPTYLFWKDEWGTQIAGLAPLYATDGSYIGMLGVDVYSTSFYSYIQQVLASVILLLLMPTLALSGLYIYLHKQYSQRMRSIAYEDQLTRLFNRRYYDENAPKILQTACHQQTPFTVLIGDVDNFKNYNDTFGHQAGDEALLQVAALLRREMEGKTGFVARYGGEEFVVITNDQMPETLGESLRSAIETLRLPHSDGTESCVTCSFGGCVSRPALDRPPADYLQMADLALYQAKAAGKNRVLFLPLSQEQEH